MLKEKKGRRCRRPKKGLQGRCILGRTKWAKRADVWLLGGKGPHQSRA